MLMDCIFPYFEKPRKWDSGWFPYKEMLVFESINVLTLIVYVQHTQVVKHH